LSYFKKVGIDERVTTKGDFCGNYAT